MIRRNMGLECIGHIRLVDPGVAGHFWRNLELHKVGQCRRNIAWLPPGRNLLLRRSQGHQITGMRRML